MFDGFNEDDDDGFFAPMSGSSSTLGSLFGVPMNTSASAPTVANASLTYTAPKQPTNATKIKDTTQKPKGNSVVIMFKEVQAFKMIEGTQSAQGKCGLALIGNETLCIYQLLLYKQKSDIICTAKVNNKFHFTALRDNYANYCDTEKLHWTVLFSEKEDLIEFTGAIETKGGIIINNIPVSKEDIPKQEVSTETFDSTLNPVIDKSDSNTKADILSRMAKMGQRLLPDTTKSSDDASSENETDKFVQKSRKPRKSASSTGTLVRSTAACDTVSNTSTSQQQYVMINGQMCPLLKSPTFVPEISISQAMLPADTYNTQQITPDKLNMYFVENRTHNCEVRMNIIRLTAKMEEMMDKVNKIDLNSSSIAEPSLAEPTPPPTFEPARNFKTDMEILENQIAELNARHENDTIQNAELAHRITNLLGEMETQKHVLEKHSKKEKSYLQQIKNFEAKINEKLLKTETNPNYLTIDVNRINLLDENVKKIMNSLYQDISTEFQDNGTLGQDAIKYLAQKIRDSTFYIIAAVKELEITDSKGTP